MTDSISRIAIIGLGLIGGSWVRSLREQRSDLFVVGYDRNVDSMEQAKSLGIIDEFALTAHEAVAKADLVILSVPILAVRDILNEIKSII